MKIKDINTPMKIYNLEGDLNIKNPPGDILNYIKEIEDNKTWYLHVDNYYDTIGMVQVI